MKTTIMEYGLVLISAVLAIFFLSGFQILLSDGGNLKDAIISYITNIC